MQTFQADLAIVGAGGAGLRAAIAAAQANPNAKIALISKVYPMRSHTVAAEGGSAAVAQDHDSFEYHFHDTVAGGDWLCEQDVVDYVTRMLKKDKHARVAPEDVPVMVKAEMDYEDSIE